MSKHVVHIAESGMVEIHRLEDDGSMILFTRMDSRTFDFSTFARLLGENLFLDSPEGRDLYDL